MKIDKNIFVQCCLCIWFLYFIYSIVITIYEYPNLKRIDWQGAENQSYQSWGGHGVIYIYQFIKDNTEVTRELFLPGINVWFLWGINKGNKKLDISFYVTNRDYNKIVNHKVDYYKTIFGERFQKRIPFFGLRKYGESCNKIMLFLDVWKYNCYPMIPIFLISIYMIIKYISEKTKIIELVGVVDEKKVEIGLSKLVWYIVYLIIGVTVVNLLI